MTRSIQQLPNNTNSSSIVEVATASGFNAGDLVYYQNGDYKSAFNLTNSNVVSFGNTQNQNVSYNLSNTQTNYVFSSTAGAIVGSNTNKFAAVLTNGNIVQVFVNTGPTVASGTGRAIYFQIVSPSGSVVISPTIFSSTYLLNGGNLNSVTVCALTGGGFVISMSNSSAQLVYGIYTNTGSVTTAVQIDTTFSNIYVGATLKSVGLANGGFVVVASQNTSAYLLFRAYNATGTGSYATVITTYYPYNANAQFGLATRSDNSIIITLYTTLTNVFYYLYNSSGIGITNGNITISTTLSQNYPPCDVTCLGDGTTYVISYIQATSSSIAYPAFRLLPSGNTLGSEIAIPYQNIAYNNNYSIPNSAISILPQASGGFVLAFADGYNSLNYAFFNASGTALSGTNTNGTLPINVPSVVLLQGNYITLVEITGYINMYWSTEWNTNAWASANQNILQVNSSTYAVVTQNAQQSIPLANFTGAAGSVVPSAVTPTNMKFYAANTATTTASFNFGQAWLSSSVIASVSCDGLSSCTLPNGQFLIAFRATGSITGYTQYNVYVNVYSVTGAFIQQINVGPGTATTGLYGCVKVVALSSGKFVVGWISQASQQNINLNLYSSSFTQIGTTATLTMSSAYSNGTINFGIAALGGGTDRYVVVYPGTSQYLSYAVYNNTNSSVVSVSNASGSVGIQNLAVSSNPYGGFAVLANSSGPTVVLYAFTQTATNTYSVTNNSGTSIATVNSSSYWNTMAYANGNYILVYQNNASVLNARFISENNNNSSFWPVSGFYGAVGSSLPAFTIGSTGNGNLIIIGYGGTTTQYLYGVVGNGTGSGSASNGLPLPNSSNYLTNFPITTSTSTYGAFQICPAWGNNFVLAWLDANGYPNFGIYAGSNYTISQSTTAGVTQSVIGSSVSPSPTATSPSIPGTIFTGVAATTASANSTGQVIINGLAQVNSNYSISTTGAFDFTGLAVDGVRGTYNGKTINLQGNS